LAHLRNRASEMTLSSSLKQPKPPSETHKSKYADYLAPDSTQENTDYLMGETQALLAIDRKGGEIDIKVEQSHDQDKVKKGAREIVFVRKSMNVIGTIPSVPLKLHGG
jgi:hypothetical protein